MSIVRKFSIDGKRQKINKLELQCNECNIIYLCPQSSIKRCEKSEYHFCSKICSNKSISNGILKRKIKSIFIKKYNSESYVSSDVGRSNINNVMIEKYGTISPFSLFNCKEKSKVTCKEKYGVDFFAQSGQWESKLDRSDIAQKAWATKIINGTCSKSAPEEKLNIILVSILGKSDIIRQKKVIKQWVDFYIISLDLYIQVDGIYWHGLNRDVDMIKLGKTTQDIKIYKQILRDEKLNNYMNENNMKLLRLTDVEVLKYSIDDIKNLLKDNYDAML